MRLPPLLRPSQPMVLAIAATLCAAGLLLHFQHRALTTLRAQTDVILRQVTERTASDVAAEIRRTLDGPVFDTLTAVNHPELRNGRLDLVAQEYAEALNAYPHVDCFLVWNADTERVAPGEVLFYPRDASGRGPGPLPGPLRAFVRDPSFGRALRQLAEAHRDEQHIYVAAEGLGPDGRYQAFLRLFWTDALRVRYFAILGYLVDRDALSSRLFATLHDRSLGTLLQQRGAGVGLEMRVIGDGGELVFGESRPLALLTSVPLPMQFYPVDVIDTRLAKVLPGHAWQLQVGVRDRGSFGDVGPGYWPTAVSVLLILVALGLTVQAHRRTTELGRMQADFIAHVSHQLKTPLSLLSAATETVAMDRVRSPQKLAQYLGIMRHEVARLSALVQRILEFSRLQQPRRFELETVPLEALVRETVAAFANSLSGQYAFTVESGGQAPMVLADPVAIEQALVNLLDNAVKYSGDSRDVRVRLGVDGDDAVIEVIDRGVGIDRADQRHIFNKFYRGRGAALNRDGFGLGLPIVQELLRAHHGLVEVESALGQGSTFRIRLPLVHPERAELLGAAESPGVPS